MKSRVFYLVTLALLTAVQPVSIASQVKAARAASMAARAAETRATGTRDETELAARRLEVRSNSRDSDRLSGFAAGLFVCGVGAWAFSISRKEGGLQGVPLLLTAMGILVQLLLV